MPGGYVYLGESAGGRVIRTGVGLTQVGDPYNLDIFTWDSRPLGDDGEAIFRWLTVLLRHTLGYNVAVTPVVDGVALQTVSFSGGPLPAPQLPSVRVEDVVRLRCWPMTRGNRIACALTSVALLGPTELVDIVYGYSPIRTGR